MASLRKGGRGTADANRTATIVVDKSESRSRIPEKLAAFTDVIVQSAELAAGDYVLSSEIIVERKAVDDLISSLLYGRLFEQLARLQLACTRPVLLIEGDLTRRRSAIEDEPLRGLFARLIVHDDIHVVQTANTTETAAMLRRLALHAQGLVPGGVRLRGPKPDAHAATVYARYLLEGLPELGPQRVDKLLRTFGSVRGVLLADPSALAAVIGPAAAQRVWAVLTAPYGGAVELPPPESEEPLPASSPPAADGVATASPRSPAIAAPVTGDDAYIDDALLVPWADALTEQGATTAQTYPGAVRRFLAWYHARHGSALRAMDLSTDLVRSYWDIIERERTPAAVGVVKTAMRSWCRWLVAAGHLATDPAPAPARRGRAGTPRHG